MAISEKHASLGFHQIPEAQEPDDTESGWSDSTEECSSDEENDPTFDILEETNSCLSNLSIDKKSKPRISKRSSTEERHLCIEEDFDQGEVIVPKLDAEDEKTFDKVQSIIQAGQLGKLKIDQCKIYLRKHGLRLTGNKDTLIRRIKEHLDVIDGGGEKKYPVSSFVWNCKGDACTGDVVLFEQQVYEMFNLASRSATSPPIGTRIVAGRIVKESYGSAKQQHTFTIEVLWSKGERPFPPLHPFLIKGRNLYRLKTMRQRWDDESERNKALLEKHSRGDFARAKRNVRIKAKETRKNLKTAARAPRKAKADSHQPHSKNSFLAGISMVPQRPTTQPQKHQIELPHSRKQQSHQIQREQHTFEGSIQNPPMGEKPPSYASSEHLSQKVQHHRQPFANVNSYPTIRNTQRQDHNLPSASFTYSGASCASSEEISDRQQMTRPACHAFGNPVHGPSSKRYQKTELCRHYIRGRCYYGDNCKYLHSMTK